MTGGALQAGFGDDQVAAAIVGACVGGTGVFVVAIGGGLTLSWNWLGSLTAGQVHQCQENWKNGLFHRSIVTHLADKCN